MSRYSSMSFFLLAVVCLRIHPVWSHMVVMSSQCVFLFTVGGMKSSLRKPAGPASSSSEAQSPEEKPAARPPDKTLEPEPPVPTLESALTPTLTPVCIITLNPVPITTLTPAPVTT